MDFRVTLDLSDLQRAGRRLARELAQGAGNAVRRACEEGAQEARTVHRYKDRTWKLTRSIRGELLFVTAGEAWGEIVAGGPRVPYARFVEEGTKAHVIRARFKKYLHWVGADGAEHFAKQVNHPGSKPYPYMGPAYLKAERVLEREIDVMVARVAEELSS
jgi:hypothetical protein